MAMINESSVREKLSALSRNDISIADVENWLAPAAWNMHSDSAPQAVELVSSIHHFLSERDDHILNESDLREALLSLLDSNVRYVKIKYSDRPEFVPVAYKPIFEV